jgi:hypothetical protein
VELVKWCRLQWDRVLAVAAMVAGVVVLVLGWVGVSSTELVAKQVPYVMSGGLGGLVLLMIGGTLWLSADFRDEWRALDRLEERLADESGAEEELARLRALLEEHEPVISTSFRLQSLQPGARDIAPAEAPAQCSSGVADGAFSLSNPLARANGE